MEGRATDDWLLRSPACDEVTGFRSPLIEGFVDPPNPRPGDTVRLHVSTSSRDLVDVDLFRLGHQNGRSALALRSWASLPTEPQPDPSPDAKRKLRCDWPSVLEFEVEAGWKPGVHLLRLTATQAQADSYAIFTLCSDQPADILVMNSITTWQAYNRWPGRFSLYDDGGDAFWYAGPNVSVGFHRPYGKYCQILDAPLSTGSGEFLLWEWPMVHWLEQEGYDVGYITSLELHEGCSELDASKALLSLGHDEFWSIEMFERASAYQRNGGHLGFFSANTCAVRIDFASHDEPTAFERVDLFGAPDQGTLARFPEMCAFPGTTPDEAELLGARSVAPTVGRGDWVCTRPDHWIYADTGMQHGDAVRGLVGWEFHGQPRHDVTVVSEGPTHHPRGDGWYTATMHEPTNGGLVFNAATCWWADGLDDPPGYVRATEYTDLSGVDPRIGQITRNILDRFVM